MNPDRFPRAIADRDFVLVRTFDKAEHFYEALQPLSGLWTPRSTDWIFRGKGCAFWDLLPSAHRERSWLRFTDASTKPFVPERATEAEREEREMELLHGFYRGADAAALFIPGDSGGMRDMLDATPKLRLRDFIPALAYAQHHGLPTRLLDWTRLAKTAAYFAALQPDQECDALAVVGVNARFIKEHGDRLAHRDHLQLAFAPRASNPNLHAQAGVFTFAELQRLVPLDQVVSAIATGAIKLLHGELNLAGQSCLVLKLVLPRIEARRLMEILHLDGISARTLFPGPSGVVQSIAERYWSGAPEEAF